MNWINTEDRMPEIGTVVFVWLENTHFPEYDAWASTATYLGGQWHNTGHTTVLYWMSIPELPKECNL